MALTFFYKNIKKKKNYMQNDSHRTSTEWWDKTLNLQKKEQETLYIMGLNKREKKRKSGQDQKS